MKTFLKLTALASLVLSSSTHANNAWVEGPLWRAPQPKDLTLKLKGKEKIAAECSLYKRAVFSADGSLTSIARDKSSLTRFRRMIEPVFFEVEGKPWSRLEQTISVDENVELGVDKLPYFSQTEVVAGYLIGDSKDLKVTGGENSYVEISRKVGLEESRPSFSQTSRGTYALRVEDRDIACDLFEGSGTVAMNTPSYVVIGDDAFARIREFYDKRLLPQLNEVLSVKSDMLTQKAARIGYRTGKILEDEFPGQASLLSEKQIRELLKILLNPKNLELSSNVIQSGKELHLNLDSGIEAKNVLIKLEF